jgi:hypothetical protein
LSAPPQPSPIINVHLDAPFSCYLHQIARNAGQPARRPSAYRHHRRGSHGAEPFGRTRATELVKFVGRQRFVADAAVLPLPVTQRDMDPDQSIGRETLLSGLPAREPRTTTLSRRRSSLRFVIPFLEP